MIRLYVSSVIEASAEAVWARIRDFNGLPLWHPGIADSRIENNEPSDRVGCIRHFHTRDGGMIRERLLALAAHARVVTASGDAAAARRIRRKMKVAWVSWQALRFLTGRTVN